MILKDTPDSRVVQGTCAICHGFGKIYEFSPSLNVGLCYCCAFIALKHIDVIPIPIFIEIFEYNLQVRYDNEKIGVYKP